MIIHFISLAGNSISYTDYLAIITAQAVYKDAEIWLWVDREIPLDRWGTFSLLIAKQVKIPEKWEAVSSTLRRLAMQSDYLRYLILYHFGGLYLDTDTVSVRDIRKLADGRLLIGEELRNGFLNPCVMYAPKKHDPTLAAIIRECNRRIDDLETTEMDKLSLGPRLVNDLLTNRPQDFRRIDKKAFHYYSWNDWIKWFRHGPVYPEIYVLHWFNSWSGDYVKRTVTPEFIKNSGSIFARCVRFARSQ